MFVSEPKKQKVLFSFFIEISDHPAFFPHGLNTLFLPFFGGETSSVRQDQAETAVEIRLTISLQSAYWRVLKEFQRKH